MPKNSQNQDGASTEGSIKLREWWLYPHDKRPEEFEAFPCQQYKDDENPFEGGIRVREVVQESHPYTRDPEHATCAVCGGMPDAHPQESQPSTAPRWSKDNPCPWCKSCGQPVRYHKPGLYASGSDGKPCTEFVSWEYPEQPSTAPAAQGELTNAEMAKAMAIYWTHPGNFSANLREAINVVLRGRAQPPASSQGMREAAGRALMKLAEEEGWIVEGYGAWEEQTQPCRDWWMEKAAALSRSQEAPNSTRKDAP